MARRRNSVPLQLSPYVLRDEGAPPGRARPWRLLSLAGDSQTGAAFNLLSVAAARGFATPLHIHYSEDVAIYVLEGSLVMFLGDEELAAPTGTYLFLPRGTPHGFRIEAIDGARILYLTVPGGFDGLTHEREFGADTHGCATAAARYKIEILGPLPE